MASIVVVLDGRESMLWPDRTMEREGLEKNITKFALAARIALHLVHRHVRFGDRVRLVLLEENTTENEASAIELKSPSHVLSLFEELEKNRFEVSCMRSFLKADSFLYSTTNLIFWMSDCCAGDFPSEFLSRCENLVLFHTLSSLECDPSWLRDNTCYFDLKTLDKKFLGQSLKRKNQYLEKLNDWRRNLQKKVEDHHGTYVLFTDKSSIRSYVATLDSLV
jgi:hypothetical protein